MANKTKSKVGIVTIITVSIIFSLANAGEIRHVKSTLIGDIHDVLEYDNLLYCSFNNGLLVLDVSNPSKSIIPLGQCFVQGWCEDIELYGNYAYMSQCDSGLPIIDISNPNNPKVVGNYKEVDYIEKLAIVDNYAFVIDSLKRLSMLNLTNPVNPEKIWSYNDSVSVRNMYVDKDRLYLVVDNSNKRGKLLDFDITLDELKKELRWTLDILDISITSKPQLICNYTLETVPDEIASRCPLHPQLQTGPSGMIVT